jgi:two-component system, OmpR family, sensor histidine kinase BaeS
MSMRWRLLGSFALIILIALGTVAIVSRITTEQEVQSFLGHGGQAGLESLTNSLEAYYVENGSWTNVETILAAGQGRGQGQRFGGAAFGRAYALTDVSGTILFSSTNAEQGTSLAEETLVRAIPLEVSGKTVGYLYPKEGLLDLPDDFEELLIERVNQASLLAGLISGGIAILIALVLAALILRPVRALTKAAQKMAEGDLAQRVQVHGADELAILGKTFNQMSRSLQEAEMRRMALTADIAHELRNPLAIQRAHLEALQDGVYPLTQENLALLTEQNQQLTRLVEDLRTLALADAGELALNKRSFDLVTMCQETMLRFDIQAKVKDILLSADCGMKTIMVDADKERLQQIHDNLMRNALRYTPEGGFIKLTLEKQGHHATFSIYNNGPQLSPEALDHLFERFYRGEKARDRASGGTGLGLAIARKLAVAHGGTLMGENHPAGGVIFKLSLPTL